MALTEDQIRLLTGHRQEAWHYRVLDLNDRYITNLDEVTSASFEFSIYTTIRSSGQLECRSRGIDWLKVRIQPWYTVWNDTTKMSWPVGVFLPSAPGIQYSGDGVKQSIELYDKLQILVDEKIANTYSVPAGTVVTEHIKALLALRGETRFSIVDSDATVRTAQVWEADTTILQIINDLLESINYFSLWVDGYGVFHGQPYLSPTERGLAWTFADDQRSIYSPDFFNDRDESQVPNVVGLVSTSDGETEALVAEARNEDPNSRYSYNQRGRWISTVELDVEADSQATLNALAQRRLVELSDVSSNYNLSHALIPLNLNDAVKFVRGAEGISTLGVVQSFSFSSEVGTQVKTTIREVIL